MRTLLVLLLLAPLSFAQNVTNAEALDPNDPRAQRASALVSLLISGDFDKAKEYFRANAAPGADASRIDQLRPLFAGGGLQLARLAGGQGADVLAVLMRAGGGRGDRLAVIVELEPAAPHRIRGVRSAQSQQQPQPASQPQPSSIIGTHAVPIPSGSKGTVLQPDADHYAVRRATQLLQALNQPGETEAFLAAAWDLQAAGETPEEGAGHVASVRERVGEGAKLLEVEVAGKDVLARLVNRHGRKSTLQLVIDPSEPHRMFVNGIMRELPEVSVEQATPKRVDLATPVATAPLTFEGGRPFVEVFVEGKGPYRFMVETGFARINLTPRVIAELGDRVQPLSEDMMYRLGETRISPIYKVDELRIGGATLRDFAISVAPKQPNVDGVLGLSTFANLLLTVDYPKKELRLEKGALPAPDGKEIFRTKKVGPFVGVDLMFGETAVPAIIDTQASNSAAGAVLSLTPEVAHLVKFEAAPVEYARALVGQAHESVVHLGRLAGDLRLGRYTFRRPLATVMTFAPEDHPAGNLGADFLRNFVMTLDQQNERVRFARSGASVIAPAPSYRSFGLSIKGDEIVAVREGTPAARAGVKVGDRIVTPKNLTSLASSGKPVAVELQRDGKTVKVTMTGEVLVR